MDRVFNELLLHEQAATGLALQALVFVAHQALFVDIVCGEHAPQRLR